MSAEECEGSRRYRSNQRLHEQPVNPTRNLPTNETRHGHVLKPLVQYSTGSSHQGLRAVARMQSTSRVAQVVVVVHSLHNRVFNCNQHCCYGIDVRSSQRSLDPNVCKR